MKNARLSEGYGMKTCVALVLLIVYTRRVCGKCPHDKGRNVYAFSVYHVDHREPAGVWALQYRRGRIGAGPFPRLAPRPVHACASIYPA